MVNINPWPPHEWRSPATKLILHNKSLYISHIPVCPIAFGANRSLAFFPRRNLELFLAKAEYLVSLKTIQYPHPFHFMFGKVLTAQRFNSPLPFRCGKIGARFKLGFLLPIGAQPLLPRLTLAIQRCQALRGFNPELSRPDGKDLLFRGPLLPQGFHLAPNIHHADRLFADLANLRGPALLNGIQHLLTLGLA